MENFHLKYPIIVNFLNFLFCCVSVSSVKHFHKYLDIQNWDVRKVSFMCVRESQHTFKMLAGP